ncbi:MAG: hypothetical protein KA160_03930 [Lacibacter sp.]|nr:hypothetical protein [Lacibacter sp.]
MKKGFSVLCFLFLTVTSFAQVKSNNKAQLLDLSGSIGSNQGSVAASYIHNWHLGKKQKFSIGAGARFTSYFGSNQYFITAPAKITSGATGPGVLFKENIQANLDSLLVSSASMNALNLSINLGYRITSKLTAGFNIDAIGFSFGGEKAAKYVNGTTVTNTTAKPTGFNALLISDNDLGTLNSELFAAYAFNKKWSAKLGFQFLFTEYTTTTMVQQFPEPNDRFRNKVSAVVFGVRYQLQ